MTGFGRRHDAQHSHHRHHNPSSSPSSSSSRIHRSSQRKTPSLDISVSSRETSPDRSAKDPAKQHRKAHDGSSSSDDISIDDGVGRMHVAGPCCFKQPTLSEVLSNTAPPPYTLSAFMAYLSQNHCLETLEFTMDASRYRKHYNAVVGSSAAPVSEDSKDCAFVRKLWKKLLDAYIVPNGPREVNLPCSIRDKLLSIPNCRTPPPPESLDPAVNIIHELMQESVLVPFLAESQSSNQFPSNSDHHHGSWDPSSSSSYSTPPCQNSSLSSSSGYFSQPYSSTNQSPSNNALVTPSSSSSCAITPTQPPALYGSISAPPSILHRPQQQPQQQKQQQQPIHHRLPHLRHSHHSEENLHLASSPVLDSRLHRRTHPSSTASPPSPVDPHAKRTVSPFSTTLGWSRPSPALNSGEEEEGWKQGPMTPPTTPPAGEKSPKRESREGVVWRRLTNGVGRAWRRREERGWS
ncbi:regulator of G protein signaling superfamily [Ascodesmis nigricans]|uniref:Regulator of G protein signaling superfamily n=1 Tax=Ascodesmis nigricans TaxID=341454 RepID=A0A4S2MUS5_9PEZI|nr:regulator of G protein signaling superfamily [Ascodesmis nigricans]